MCHCTGQEVARGRSAYSSWGTLRNACCSSSDGSVTGRGARLRSPAYIHRPFTAIYDLREGSEKGPVASRDGRFSHIAFGGGHIAHGQRRRPISRTELQL